MLIESIWELGFDVRDIKHILHSHGHYDHLGATKALVEITGAKTWIGTADAPYADGRQKLMTWANELGFEYHEQFEPDFLINDGDVFELGSVKIEMLSTPGHTPGTISFFFDMPHKERKLTVGMHGGVGTNSMCKSFLEKYSLDFSCRQDFFAGLEKLSKKKVDVFIGNHTWNNDTIGKSKSITEEHNPFIDEDAWPAFLLKCKANLQAEIDQNG
jgi:metallo-beta-lactamase class B